MIWILAVVAVVVASFTLPSIVTIFVAIAAGILACVLHDIIRNCPPHRTRDAGPPPRAPTASTGIEPADRASPASLRASTSRAARESDAFATACRATPSSSGREQERRPRL